MGIKDETPDDKVIFDSINNRMKYSKGVPNVDTEISKDIIKTESELDIKLNKIENMLKDISYNLELLGDEIGKIEERLGI